MIRRNTNIKAQFSGYNNRPHKMPDPKLMHINTKYALSLNAGSQPFEYLEHNDTHKGDIQIYTNEILKKIKLCTNAEIEVYPEISSSGRWHYHGYIVIKNLAKFLLFDFNYLKQYFCFEIDTIGDIEEWTIYVNKGSHYMEEYCKESDIPYKITTTTKPIKVKDKLQDLKYEWKDDYNMDGEWVGAHKEKIIE